MTNNSSVLLYLFRAQISSNLLGIIYGKNQEPTPRKEHKVNTPYSTSHKPEVILTNFFAEPTVLLVPITSRGIRNQDIIMVYEAVIKVDIYGVGLANTPVQL
jgi:hypothetical protein